METAPEMVRVILDDGVYEGGLQDGDRSGFGTYVWNNGDFFEGHYLANKKHGQGRYVWASTGDSYTGEYSNNKKHGHGILVSKSTGVTYEGGFVHGKRCGHGSLKCSDGTAYIGAFLGGKRSGRGKLHRPNGDVYEGDFKGDVIEGKGLYRFRDGRVYEGCFRGGARHGEGTFKAAFARAFYTGSFENDVFSGYGQYTRQSGDTYSGFWQDGKPHGKGSCKYADGTQYSGEWREGLWSGQGRVEYPNHSIYMGAFAAGLKSGSGAYAGCDGTTFEGNWARGLLVSGKALGHIGSVGIDDFASSEFIDLKYAALNPSLDFVCRADSIIGNAIAASGVIEERVAGGQAATKRSDSGSVDIIINTIIELETENFQLAKQLGAVNYEYLHGRIQSLEEENARLRAAVGVQDAQPAPGSYKDASAGGRDVLTRGLFPSGPAASDSEKSSADSESPPSPSLVLQGLSFYGYGSKKSAPSSVFGAAKTGKAEDGGSLSSSTRRFFAFGRKTAEGAKGLASDPQVPGGRSGACRVDEAAGALPYEDTLNGSSGTVAEPAAAEEPASSRPASPSSSSVSAFSTDRPERADNKRRLKLASEPVSAFPYSGLGLAEHPLSGMIQQVTNPSRLVTDSLGYAEGGSGRFEFFLIEPDLLASRGRHNEYSLPSKVSWVYTDGRSSNIDCMNEFCFPNGVPFDVMSSSCSPYATGAMYDKLHVMQFSSAGLTTYACCLTVVSAQLPPQEQPELCEELLARAVRIRAARRIKSNIYMLFKKMRRKRWDMTGRAGADTGATSGSVDSDLGERSKVSFISKYFRRGSVQSPEKPPGARESALSADPPSPRPSTLEEAARLITANTSSFAARRSRGNPSLRNKVLVTQQTYCIMSTRPDHAYYFRALRAMAAAERAILSEDIFNKSSSSAKRQATINRLISDKRNAFLSALHFTVLEHMRQGPSQQPCDAEPGLAKELVGETVSGDFEGGFTLRVEGYVQGLHMRVQELPATEDWAAAVLFSCCSSRIIFKVINLMLTERSLIIYGQNAGLVTAVATALHSLIKPFHWAGVFVPLVPLSATELFEAPVPFILGTTSLPDTDRISPSAAVIALDDPQATHSNEFAHRRGYERPDTEAWFTRLPEVSSDMPISEALEGALNSGRRMLLACKKKAVGEGCGSGDRVAMIHSYHLYDLCFVESMARRDIALVRSMLRQICDANSKYCGDVSDVGAWKNYVRYNPQTGEDEFHSSWFMQSARRQVEFQETLACTQLFVAYIDSLRRRYSEKDRQRLLLAHWIGYRLYLRHRAAAGGSLITTENINSILEHANNRA